MPALDPRVDAYIAKAQPFARPILERLRELVHKACPDAEETIKWSFPHFDYKGAMCSMASFRQHAVFGFWKASLMKDSARLFNLQDRDGMGHFGKMTSLADVPPEKVMLAYIREAMELNEYAIKLPPKKKADPAELVIPAYLKAALKGHAAAAAQFKIFTPGRKREYVLWLEEAKTEATRIKRLETALEWIAEGKSRNWKYEKK